MTVRIPSVSISGIARILKSSGPLIQLQHYTGVDGILVPGHSGVTFLNFNSIKTHIHH